MMSWGATGAQLTRHGRDANQLMQKLDQIRIKHKFRVQRPFNNTKQAFKNLLANFQKLVNFLEPRSGFFQITRKPKRFLENKMNQPESEQQSKSVFDQHKTQIISQPSFTITKRALYSLLADKYYLPPRDSKGVSRLYLEKVDKDTCFRVELIQMKRFLAELSPSQTKRSLHTNKAEAFFKLTTILRELGFKPLCFEAEYVPDSEWLFNVLRYVDRSNASGVFEHELMSHPNVKYDSALLLKIKKTAEQVEFVDTGFLKNKKTFGAIQNLIELQRRLTGRKAEAQMMMRDLEAKKSRILTDEQEISQELTSIVWGGKGDIPADIPKQELAEMRAKLDV